MKGDFTRNTFRREKHYASVRMQQGRVQLDSDWNEQLDIAAHRAAAGAVDTIGAAGAPKHQPAFGIVNPATLDAPTIARLTAARVLPLPPGDLLFSPGRFYADGALCEVEDYFRLSQQPDAPGAAAIAQEGQHLVYLDVWQRHLTALDDGAIRETALGGPDTATRTRTIWQVKTRALAQAKCISEAADWEKLGLVTPTAGRLAARAQPEAAAEKPCLLPPGAGYRRLENQLYRVEIHQPGPPGKATFKWSRDNGTVVTRLLDLTGVTATVEDLGRDAVLGFNNGDRVELTDDARELNGQPGVLAQIDVIDRANLKVRFTEAPVFTFAPKLHPKLRRWDDPAGERDLKQGADAGGFVALEAGVQVRFTDGHYNTGDYWLIPARTASHDVEWPAQTDAAGEPVKDAAGHPVPAEQMPLGITHALACLAVVTAKLDADRTITLVKVDDCRKVFPPLTEMEDPEEAHRRHNRYLHGWGVVCGLQVHCGGKDRRTVQIEPGYALQCDGSEIVLPPPGRPFEVVEAARAAGLLTDNAGKVRVTLAATAPDKVTFGVRASAEDSGKSFLERLLAGTFWMDVFSDCLKPLVDLAKRQFLADDPKDKRLVKAPARRLITAFNLGLEFVNPARARNVFLSEEEHGLLKDLHDGLRKLLQDPVFCGIFDGLPPFPDYPFKEARILTGFGKAALPRVRLAPSGRVAYAFGPGAGKVFVFDLARARGEMTAEIELPVPAGAGSVEVRDLAFFDRARQLLVAGVTGNGNSVLYRYQVSKEGTKYDPAGDPVVAPGQRVLRVAEVAADLKALYALVQNVGLVRFNPTDFGPDEFSKPLVAFEPTGHWTFGEDVFPGTILAVGMPRAGTAAFPFPPICIIQRAGEAARLAGTIPLDAPCADDPALLFSPAAGPATRLSAGSVSTLLYVAVGPKPGSQNKRLLVFRPPSGEQNTWSSTELDADTSGDVGLAATADHRFMLVTLADLCQLRWLDPARNEWATERTLPVQIHPMGLAASKSVVLVANRDSHTLSLIPAGAIAERAPVTLQAVADYRAALLELARALALRLAQKLKDCLCEHLVQNCPVCEPDDRIELAGVEIREGKVWHIANCCRREVITFPKFKYWLSVAPVWPLLSWAVLEFCSVVLLDLFKPRPQFGVAAAVRPAAALAPTNALTLVRDRLTAPQLRLVRDNLAARFSQVTRHLAAAAKVEAVAPLQPDVAVRVAEVVNADEQTVKSRLQARGVVVNEVADFDAAVAARPWASLADLQFDFKAGDRVNLLVKDGKVAGITAVRATAPTEELATAPPAELAQEVARLNTRLATMQAEQAAYLAARKKEMTEVKSKLTKFNTILRTRTAGRTRTNPSPGPKPK